MPLDAQRWNKLCDMLGIAPDSEEFTHLDTAYAEKQRAYHTARHINECLHKLDWAMSQQEFEGHAAVAAALWYHDAVYEPTRHDNEAKSADWAIRFLQGAGVNQECCSLVHSLIMETSHGDSPEGETHQLMVDIDLSILGSSPERFAKFEQEIRQEYSWVPLPVYQQRRTELLRFFLAKPRIYCLDIFHDSQEVQARHNIWQAIATLTP